MAWTSKIYVTRVKSNIFIRKHKGMILFLRARHGRAMARAASGRPLTAEARILVRVIPVGFYCSLFCDAFSATKTM